ncbi:UNVERIFIED_CONTAM: hypothetical protein ABID98_003297 [Brevibacillus sp. OAP136]|uniref:hypothetical protein n=1 Tax=Brevibacillus fluminis TaxID=511487 RepID=UPI001606CEDE|nr:hypothetical protein [Brevibacillus fluminis]
MLLFLYATFAFLLFVGFFAYKVYRFTVEDTTAHDMNFVWVDFPITRKDIRIK